LLIAAKADTRFGCQDMTALALLVTLMFGPVASAFSPENTSHSPDRVFCAARKTSGYSQRD